MICYLTGIAAANVEIEGTDVAATTIHALFDLNPEMESKLDFTKGKAAFELNGDEGEGNPAYWPNNKMPAKGKQVPPASTGGELGFNARA